MINMKGNKTFIHTLCNCFIFILISYTIMFFFNDSYAVYAVSDFPSSTFSASYSDESNLIADALGSSTTRTSNYSVKTNYRADNKIVYSMMKNLVQPRTTEKFEILANDNPTTLTDSGILYILSHGYNQTNTANTVFTTKQYGEVTDAAKEYITQIALWLYIYENKTKFNNQYCIDTGAGYSSCDFHNNGTVMAASDVRADITSAAKKNNFLNYIILLVDNAKSYSGNKTPSMNNISVDGEDYQISEDGTTLLTSEITPIPRTNSENYMYYSVRLNDPNNYGAYLVDTNNKKITNLNNLTGTFKVFVPLKEDLETMDLSSISIHIIGTFVNLGTEYTYRVTATNSNGGKLLNDQKKQKFSDILLVYVPINTAEIAFSLENIIKVSKIDATSKEELPGATLVIKDKEKDSIVVSMLSTTSPKYLSLEEGDYTLCETEAPEGYALNNECIDFTVDGKKFVSITMENNKVVKTDVPIPNTKSTISRLISIIGGIILVIGTALVCGPLLRKRENSDS